MKYVMLVDGEPGRYGASFPDVPGCTAMAGDLDAILTIGPEVLAFHLEGLAEDGGVPLPLDLERLRADPRFEEDFRQARLVTLVDVEPPGRTVRVNITLPESVLARVDRAAEREGKSRSAFLADAARRKIAAID